MRVLFLTFYFPPYNTMGAIRTGKTARYLRELGHDVHVISAAPQFLSADLELEMPQDCVTYTNWLGLPSRKRRPAAPRPGPSRSPGDSVAHTGARLQGLKALAARIYWELMVPDEQIGWYPFATRAAKAVIRHHGADIVFASGGPNTALLVGRHIARAAGLPWVAELRDSWMEHPYRGRHVVRDLVEAPLARRTLVNADGLVTVTLGEATRLAKLYGRRVTVVYNGFDPTDVPSSRIDDPARLTIRCMGSMYDEMRIPHALFQVIKELGHNDPPIHVEFYGTDLTAVSAAAAAAHLDGIVSCHGAVTHEESLRLQRNADILLLAMSPSEHNGMPGKLFEYLSVRRPILLLGCPDGEAAGLVRSTGAGVPIADESTLRRQLESWCALKKANGAIADGPSAPDEFTREQQTRKLACFLEEVAAAHRARRTPARPHRPTGTGEPLNGAASIAAVKLSVGVIVCTKDRQTDLMTLVDSLLGQTRLPAQLVIVDAGSDPGLEATLNGALARRIRLTYVHAAPGLPRQRNLGIATSDSDVVVFLDDDVVLDASFVAEVGAFFAADTTGRFHAMLGEITDRPSGQGTPSLSQRGRRAAARSAERVFLLWGAGDGRIKRSGFGTRAERCTPGEVQFLPGCCMCFRRSVFDDIRFDEKLGGYAWMEDVDISRQLLKHGYRSACWPAARLIHNNSTAARTASTRLGNMMAYNHHYLYCKHSGFTMSERTAFWWSSAGLIAHAAGEGDWRKTGGLLMGYRDILAHRNPLLNESR